jgi:hypothetical protein
MYYKLAERQLSYVAILFIITGYRENYIRSSFIINDTSCFHGGENVHRPTSCRLGYHNLYPQYYYLGDQIKENEMGRTCSAYGRDEKCTQDF